VGRNPIPALHCVLVTTYKEHGDRTYIMIAIHAHCQSTVSTNVSSASQLGAATLEWGASTDYVHRGCALIIPLATPSDRTRKPNRKLNNKPNVKYPTKMIIMRARDGHQTCIASLSRA